MTDFLSFHLPEEFVKDYSSKKIPWGFNIGADNSLGELTFVSKYSRLKEDGTKERWHEVCERVINGQYSILKDWCQRQQTQWNEYKAQQAAKDAYDRMFHFKWMPAGRGLWAMGTSIVNEKKSSAALFNCSFITTEKMSTHSAKEATWPFVRLMEMCLTGIGVGFDTRGADSLTIHAPLQGQDQTITIDDTREAWAWSVGKLLETYFFKNRNRMIFDYSHIRPNGEPIKTFGGVAPGPQPLIDCHEKIREILDGRSEHLISSSDIVDLMNLIGKAVVSGGQRRSALLSLGKADDEDFISLKDPELHPERMGPNGWGYTSNNSVIAEIGGDYSHLAKRIADNGEPGLFWLDLTRQYGRLADPVNNKDYRINGLNPCMPGWGLVTTYSGPTKLDEVSVGDEIWSSEGWTKVVAKWSTGIKEVYEYTTSKGSLFLTSAHKVVSNGVKIEIGETDSIDDIKGNNYPILSSHLYSTEEVFDITVDNSTHTFDYYGFSISNCAEISLEGGGETCNLVETFPYHHKDLDDYKKTLKHAYLYGKAVNLLPTPWPETNEILQRNRRIGVSMSGVAQFAEDRGWQQLREWMDEGYKVLCQRDTQYSEWLGIRESIKKSTVKPAGTTAILAGATPGVHWPTTSDYYIRRIRFVEGDRTLSAVRAAGYHVEKDVMEPKMTRVASFPTIGLNVRNEREVSMWEKTELAVLAQRWWSDNMVSVTVSFGQEEKDQIPALLRSKDGQLKTLSMLPLFEGGETSYAQMPYEAITKEQYDKMIKKVKPIDWEEIYSGGEDAEGEKFCTTDHCEIPV